MSNRDDCPRNRADLDDAEKIASFGERYGWLLGAIWVVFLIYPLIAVFVSDTPALIKVLGCSLVVMFGAVYVFALGWINRVPPERRAHWPVSYLAMLVTIVLALVPVIRLGVLGFMPFLVSYSLLALSRAAGLTIYIAGIALSILIPIWGGIIAEWWFMSIIVALTGATAFFVRLIEAREAQGEVVKEQLAVVAERERVARDVHDVLGHSLTVVTVKAELAERLLDVDVDRAKAELQQIQSLTRQALAEIRATVGGLRVARLGDELEVARTALAAAGIAATVPEDPDVVDPRYRIIFAWALREAITNVVRHSGASECTVSLSERELAVIDNGRGIVDGVRGNGLLGITERVEAASGRVEIGRASDAAGTSLKVVM